MAGNDLNRSIKITIDGSSAAQGIEPVQKAIAKLESRLAGLNKQESTYAEESAKLKKELEAKNRTLNSYRQRVQETEKVLNNLSGSTYKQLSAVQRQLRDQLQNLVPGTQRYNATLEQHRRVTEAVTRAQREMRVEVGSQGTAWGRAVGSFNKYAAVVTAGVAAITGVTMKLNQMRDVRDKREDGKSDVQALTGLAVEDIQWLEQEAIKLSTTMNEQGIRITQSATEILDAYKLVGSAKPDLLDNKEALAAVTEQTLILASASGMDLKSAVDGVTLAMNQYSADANQAARYTNVLAAGSKFGAAAVNSITNSVQKSGVAAAQAGVPIEQLVGSIETLAEKGIKDEIAGTGLKKFFLTLQTDADDTNPKVVGLSTALENLAAKQLTAAQMKKMFGEEGYNVATVMIQEKEKVEQYTAAVTGTVVALEQANIKSDTASAKRAQAKNQINEMSIVLMDRLSPAILKTTNGLVNWSSKLVSLISFMAEHWRVIGTVLIAFAAYTAATKLQTMFQNVLTVSIEAGTFSVNKFNAALKRNIFGLVLAGLAAAINYFDLFKTKTDEATTSLGGFNAEAERMKMALDLVASVKLSADNIEFLTDKQKQQLKQDALRGVEELEKLITEEMISSKEWYASEKKTVLVEAGDNEILQRSYLRDLDERLQERIELIQNYTAEKERLTEIAESIKDPAPTGNNPDGDTDSAQEKKAAIEREKILYTEQQTKLKKLYAEGNDENLQTEKQYQERLLELKRAYLTRTIELAGAGTREAADAESQLADMQIQAKQEQIAREIEEEKELYAQHQRELKEAYISQEDENLQTQEEYNEAKEQLNILHLERLLEIAGMDASARMAIEEQLLDFKMKCINEENAERDRKRKEDVKKEEQNGKQLQDAYRKRIQTYKQYGVEVGNALGQVIAGQENAMAAFSDTMIDMVWDVLSQIVEAEIIKATATATGAVARSEAESFATPDSVLTFGASGAARAAIMTGLIMGALTAAKVALKSLIGGRGSSSESVSTSTAVASSKPSASVSVSQWAKGNYDVIGKDDGKTYNNIPYIGDAKTGIVQRTSLVSENGAELIVNAEDLKRLQHHVNYPIVIDAINDARRGTVTQRAQGNYEEVDAPSKITPQSTSTNNSSISNEELIAVVLRLIDKLSNLKAYVTLRDIRDAEDKDNRNKTPFAKR
ncbi:MAG: phage tail tape measure protein [Phocaeicola sp.]